MKILTSILCLFCLIGYASAQDSAHVKMNLPIRDFETLPDTKNPIYVIDDFVEDSLSVKKLNPADIFAVTLLQVPSAIALYGYQATNGATVIITREYAQKLYQKKLSEFSKKYKDYIAQHGDDSKLLYVLNNTILQIDKKSLSELYNLQPADIKKVTFKTDSRFANDATVVIITNDDN